MCDSCDYKTTLGHIKQAVEDASELPEKAEAFVESVTEKLTSIAEWIDENKHVTDAQKEAVENMWGGVERWQQR